MTGWGIHYNLARVYKILIKKKISDDRYDRAGYSKPALSILSFDSLDEVTINLLKPLAH